MKKIVFVIFAAVVVVFLVGVFFDKPNLFPAVVGIPLAILIFILGSTKKIALGLLILIVGVLFVTGGMYLQGKLASVFQVKNVQASSGSVFVVDAQNIDFEMPKNEVAEAKSAQSEASNQSIPEASSSNCVYFDQYPSKVLPWCALIEAESNEHGVDPLLIASVMLQESGGQPEVMSHSGAVGLMQVMPRDGISASFQCINGPCFANRPSIEELKNPSFNVDYGVRMIAGLIEKWGDIREALKSYGPYDVGYQYADKILAIRNGL